MRMEQGKAEDTDLGETGGGGLLEHRGCVGCLEKWGEEGMQEP